MLLQLAGAVRSTGPAYGAGLPPLQIQSLRREFLTFPRELNTPARFTYLVSLWTSSFRITE